MKKRMMSKLALTKKWHRRLREMGPSLWSRLIRDFRWFSRNLFPIKPAIVDGYPTFSSIPYEHRNSHFLAMWLTLDTERFDQIPDRLVTTEMRCVFCETDLGRLKRFEILPYDEFEALAILLFERGLNTPTISPELLRESFLLKTVCHVAFHYVTAQTHFHEHLFTQRVISRVVKQNLAWAWHLHSDYAAYDRQCRERIKQMVTDDDLLYQYGSEGGKNLFPPEDIEYLAKMGRVYLVDRLVGVGQWSFFLDIPTTVDHCLWLMIQPNCNEYCTVAYRAWLRQFPVAEVLAMADKRVTWHKLIVPVFESSLLKPFFEHYSWLKGHVLEDMLGL
jgi:hypothetical protein